MKDTHTRRAALASLGDGVWLATEPVRIVGTRLTTTMTVLRLGDGALLVHSPTPLTPARRAEIDALGRVAHLYAPNTFHHLWLGEWAAAFPGALVHAPAALASKQRNLRIHRAHESGPHPGFEGVLDEVPIRGFRLDETVLMHRPSRTLVVADLVHQIGRPTDLWTVIYSRLAGFYDRVALSRVLRCTAFSDRRAARRSLDEVLDLGFDRVVVGHGAPIMGDARSQLAAAYAWMPAATSRLAASPGRTRSLTGSPCG